MVDIAMMNILAAILFSIALLISIFKKKSAVISVVIIIIALSVFTILNLVGV